MTPNFRRQYLSELGLAQWYTRKQLIGAPPSPVLEWPDSKDIAEPAQSESLAIIRGAAEAAPGSTARGVSGPNELLAGLRQEDPDLRQTSAPVSSAVTAVEPDRGRESEAVSNGVANEDLVATQSLNFQAYQYADCLFIEDAGQGFVAPDVQKLIDNILFACLGGRPAPPQIFSFTWPVFNRSEVAQLAGVSGEVLVSRWLATRLDSSVKRVLMHGAIVEGFAPVLDKFSASEENEVACFPHPLSSLIARPSLKREYWQFLLKHQLVKERG